jgi:hypothetical protein
MEALVSDEMTYVRISGPSDVSLADLKQYGAPPDGVEFRVRRSADHMLGGVPEVILIVGVAKQVLEGTGYATLGALIADWAKGLFRRSQAERPDGADQDAGTEFNAAMETIDSDHPEREHVIGEATTVRTTKQFAITFEKIVTREVRKSG